MIYSYVALRVYIQTNYFRESILFFPIFLKVRSIYVEELSIMCLCSCPYIVFC